MLNSTIDFLLYGTPQQKEMCEKAEKMFNDFVNEKYPDSICILRFFNINHETNTITLYFIRKSDNCLLEYKFDKVELPLN